MNICLVDVDGHNFPNLALMKLSAWHKSQGDAVSWYDPLFSKPDKIYASKVFSFTPDYADYAPGHPEPIRGGTGYNLDVLPPEIEELQPDYSLYPAFKAAYGFLTRGCIRKCPWCIVPEKEGAISLVGDIQPISQGRRDVVLMDNNFLAAPETFVALQLWTASRLKVRLDFNQGLDARLVTPDIAKMLAACKWIRYIRFSCDTLEMMDPIRKAVSYIREAGSRREIFCYMLVKDIADAEIRLRALVELGVTPFAQPYRSYTGNTEPSPELRKFASFANIKGGKLSRKMKFSEYYK